MAEQVEGALNSLKGNTPEEKQETSSFASGILQKAMAERQKENVAAGERLKTLMNSLDSRRNMPFNPMLMRLAAGMLQPTKTGSFGESLGYAASGMSEQAEKDFKQKQEDAKLRFELENKMAEQRRQAAGMDVTSQLLMGRPQGVPQGAPVAPPVAPTAGAEVPVRIDSVPPPLVDVTSSNGVVAPSAPSAPVAPSAPSAPIQLADARKIGPQTLEERYALSQLDPDGAKFFEYEVERERKERKLASEERVPVEAGGIKTTMSKQDHDKLLGFIENGNMGAAQKMYNKYGMPFSFVKDGNQWRPKNASELAAETEKAKAESSLEMKDYRIPELGNDFYPMLPKDYADYRRSKLESSEALEKWLSTYRSKAEDRVVGSEERKAISAGRTTEQQKLAETRAETRKSYFDNARLAETLSRPAKNIFTLASDPIRSKALGLLEDPTVGDAFLGVIAQGAAVGAFNVGIPAIREAVAKLKGTTDEEKSKIMDSFQALARNYSELELNFTRMYLRGEGAVTEGERKIVRDVSGGLGNRRNVALAQAETLMQRTEFDKKVKSELMAWEKKNPGKSIEDFQESKQYTSLKNSLENNMDKIYDKYFSDSKPKTEPKTELKTEPDGKPMSIIDRLKAEKAARKLAAEKAPKGTQ